MKAKLIGTLIVTAALGLIAGGLAATALASGSGDEQGDRVKTIVLTGKRTNVEPIDLGKKGDSPGDMLVGGVDLFQNAKKVGHTRFTCVFNFPPDVMCTNHSRLPGGQLISQQLGDLTKPVVVEPIVGGTGEFRSARGEVRVEFAGEEAKLTIRLLQ
jgi:hypothetical protein